MYKSLSEEEHDTFNCLGLSSSTKADLPSPRWLYNPLSVYDNYKMEEITCKGLVTMFDGEEQILIPWLDHIWECCISDPWSPATYFTNDEGITYDLLTSFAAIDEEEIHTIAQGWWGTANAPTLSHQCNSSQFQSNIFGRFLVNSIMDDLYSTIMKDCPFHMTAVKIIAKHQHQPISNIWLVCWTWEFWLAAQKEIYLILHTILKLTLILLQEN